MCEKFFNPEHYHLEKYTLEFSFDGIGKIIRIGKQYKVRQFTLRTVIMIL